MSPFRFGQQSVVTSPAPTDFGRFYSNVHTFVHGDDFLVSFTL